MPKTITLSIPNDLDMSENVDAELASNLGAFISKKKPRKARQPRQPRNPKKSKVEIPDSKISEAAKKHLRRKPQERVNKMEDCARILPAGVIISKRNTYKVY